MTADRGSADLDNLRVRNNGALRLAESGDPGAPRLFADLLPAVIEVHGPDHPDTLRLRNNHAAALGMTGDVDQAITEFRELLPDYRRVFGPDSPEMLSAQGNLNHWLTVRSVTETGPA